MFRRKKQADADLTVRELWDRERARAVTSAERAEIDALFSQYI